MNSKLASAEAGIHPLDAAKYLAAVLVMAAGITGWYLLPWATPLRVLVVMAAFIAAAAVALPTAKGRQFREFANESLFELRKVVWPTQEETRRTTLVILVVVVIVSLVLALFDWLISLAVRGLLG